MNFKEKILELSAKNLKNFEVITNHVIKNINLEEFERTFNIRIKEHIGLIEIDDSCSVLYRYDEKDKSASFILEPEEIDEIFGITQNQNLEETVLPEINMLTPLDYEPESQTAVVKLKNGNVVRIKSEA